MSGVEKRKSTRRIVTYPALIDIGDGSPPLRCTFCDASQDGAKLLVADPASLPDRFTLALSADGAARRRCRVMWRRERELGVEFIKDVKNPARTPFAPRFNFADPTPLEPAESTDEPQNASAAGLVTLPPR